VIWILIDRCNALLISSLTGLAAESGDSTASSSAYLLKIASHGYLFIRLVTHLLIYL
jgi:hypothetical protein